MILTTGNCASEQFDTLQSCSQTDFRQVFEYATAVLQFGGHICWAWPAKCAGWSSVELRDFRAQQKSCGRDLFVTACDSWFFAKRENDLFEYHRSSHLILVSKSTWVSSVK